MAISRCVQMSQQDETTDKPPLKKENKKEEEKKWDLTQNLYSKTLKKTWSEEYLRNKKRSLKQNAKGCLSVCNGKLGKMNQGLGRRLYTDEPNEGYRRQLTNLLKELDSNHKKRKILIFCDPY